MDKPDSAGAISFSRDGSVESPAKSVRTVVVAHGNNGQRRVISECLAEHGLRVLAASNGREALGHVLMDEVDLVVAAVTMDEMDGLELLRFVSMKPPGVPVIILGSNSSEVETICLRAASLLGAAKTYKTPPPSADLLRAVNELLA